jgi:hypothetical protein
MGTSVLATPHDTIGAALTKEGPALRLDSDWMPSGNMGGILSLALHNLASAPLKDFRLALNCLVSLPGAEIDGASLVEQFAGYHVLSPEGGLILHQEVKTVAEASQDIINNHRCQECD